MYNYLNLIKTIVENGIKKNDRTGIGSISIFGECLKWNLNNGFPLVTLRKTPFRLVFEETMFFLRGQSNTKILEEKKVNIWKGNTSRKFLDSRGLNHLPEGDFGRGYGVQWRDWKTNDGRSIDQLVELINGLRNDPNGRRHIISSWNVGELDQMALPPCHIEQQYVILDGKLHSSWRQRSVDVIYGLPFNIASYALLHTLFAKLLKLECGTLTLFAGDVHIYNNQYDMAMEMIQRNPITLPELILNKELNTLEDLLSLEYTDIILSNYNSHPDVKNKPPMAI